MVGTTSSVAAAWHREFLEEFGGDGIITTAGIVVEASTAQLIELPPRVSPWSRGHWSEALFTASGKLPSGSAPRPDMLPPELYRAGSYPCARILAGLFEASFSHGVPVAWLGGRMAAVPKQAGFAPQLANSQGILCSDVSGKLSL